MEWLFDLLGRLAPLKRKRRPNLAAFIAFLTGGLGLAIYLRSFIEMLILMVINTLSAVQFGVEGYLVTGALSGIWAYLRVLDSNRRLDEAAALTAPGPAGPATRAATPPHVPVATAAPVPTAEAATIWSSTGPAPAPTAGTAGAPAPGWWPSPGTTAPQRPTPTDPADWWRDAGGRR